jgi:hypothetical protein
MKPKLTLLALLVAGVIHIQAQEPTAREAAWSALVAAKKTEAAASTEALALKNQILAGSTISKMESVIVAEVETAHGGADVYKAAFRAIAASSKTGDGVTRARATVKFWDGDTIGWTDEMVASRYDLACALASRPTASTEFKNQVWSVLKTRSAHPGGCRAFFKAQRATLPKAEQIEVTRTQKELLLAIPTRDAAANAWLAEISADLVALQLDIDQ